MNNNRLQQVRTSSYRSGLDVKHRPYQAQPTRGHLARRSESHRAKGCGVGVLHADRAVQNDFPGLRNGELIWDHVTVKVSRITVVKHYINARHSRIDTQQFGLRIDAVLSLRPVSNGRHISLGGNQNAVKQGAVKCRISSTNGVCRVIGGVPPKLPRAISRII